LTELDGLDARKSVYVIAATNRPDMIDPAMVRPGRLDKLLYVDLPSADERAEIVRTLVGKRVPLESPDVLGATEALARSTRCEGYSGADLAAVVREAGVVALKRTLGALDRLDASTGAMMVEEDTSAERPQVSVGLSDFVQAIDKVGPSVSAAQRRKYEALRNKFAGLPVKMTIKEEAVEAASTSGAGATASTS
jgi:ribosome biogenesis ATPase